ncbi:2-C-methyl-D-erythritol 4-phosphate cytidylyltransferase/2-C-methyl-D-erythritol 4-phosphate cytidylyltransferase / 2-C-methyl-D-erythritol 2,4-cyclodiphosphate synthase [Frankineae bacterium MT45]|nr:2-C-methyl-D-erythritol 4-phosphate cytidylyltransferase/2-C-methyl-D-erythritol 4-phosphate cytidylyltransferase / 2-C-methyl-D-erythritol 2,4-cyclodiphosphate synthase [Frankineae bacterium MT45]
MIVAAIFVAAGAGRRLGAAQPKAFARLGGLTLIEHALLPFAGHPSVRDLIVVAPSDRLDEVARLSPAATVVAGGEARQDSVLAGLAALRPEVDVVLVHDVARPFVPSEVIDRVLAAVEGGAQAVIPVRPVSDTIKRVHGVEVVATVDRADLRAVQTPQGFRRDALLAAHRHSVAVTDDAALVEADGGRVVVVDGSDEAFKITHPWDLFVAEALLARRSGASEVAR